MTSIRDGVVAQIVAHVGTVGAGRVARRHLRWWAQHQPILARFACPAEAAAACRAARGSDQDRLLAGLLAVCRGDDWAQLTVLAGLADRLAWVIAGWARAGMAPDVVADAEAELVAACWSAIASWGDGPESGPAGLVLVDRAREQVRVGRRRQRRHDARCAPLPVDLPTAAVATGRPGLEGLAVVVTDAVTERQVPLRQAQAVYLTRVAGWSTTETGRLLGCDPAVVRVLRARAAARLAA